MPNLKEDVQSEFMEGKFSKIGLDHNHKQLNGKIRGVGGTTGLKENDSSLQWWLVVGHETARLIDELEYSIGLYQLKIDVQEHHDSNEASHQLKQAFKEFDSPFLDNSSDIISLAQIQLLAMYK